MKIKLRYKKISNTRDKSDCYYCSSKTNNILIGQSIDYFEVWCCKACYKKNCYLIKKFVLKPNSSSIIFSIIKELNKKNDIVIRI